MKYKVFTLFSILMAVGVLMGSAFALSNGAPDLKCAKCHKNVVGSVDIKISGLPDRYKPGETYTIEIEILSDVRSTGFTQGGFAIEASAGELKVIDEKNTLKSGKYVTHTTEGAGKRKWKVAWQAPDKPVEVTISVSAIASNGDASPANDAMGLKTVKIKPELPSKALGYLLIIIGVGLLVFAILYKG